MAEMAIEKSARALTMTEKQEPWDMVCIVR